ncbi:MAG: protein kinase [Planctomycetota bacterium]|nr:protein kinase [Planctomycetota bacterium]
MIPDFSDAPALLEWLQKQSELSDYTLEKELSRGPNASAFLAKDKLKKRLVCIKVFAKTLSDQDWEESAQEARFQMQLTHISKAKIFRYSKVGPWAFLVREYIDGCSLSEWVLQDPDRRVGLSQFRELLSVFASVSEALVYCHRSGLIHGNIKPSNIIIEKSSQRAVLTDFLLFKGPGASSQTFDKAAFFPSPEQKSPDISGPVTAKTDVWALAASLFIVARHSPMSPASWVDESPETIRKHLALELNSEANEAPAWLVELIDSAIQNEASRRTGMEEFASVVFERSLGTPPNKIVLALLTLAILIFVAYYLRG